MGLTADASRTPSALWWLALVPACALPLFVVVWQEPNAGELAGRLAGVAIWTAVMMRLHRRLLGRGEDRRVRVLMWAALGFGALQAAAGAASVVAGNDAWLVFFLLLYYPVVQVASWLRFLTDMEWDPGVNLWLTLLSGGYVFLWVWVLSRLVLRFRPAPASALTPAG